MALFAMAFLAITISTSPTSQVIAANNVSQPVAPIPVLPPDAIQVENLVNSERSKVGIPLLTYNSYLTQSAQAKCDDMVARDYWAHNTPDGISPWPLITSFYGKYAFLGENLESGIPAPTRIVAKWMGSPEHKANILDTDYQDVGTAVCKSDNYQHMGMQYIVVEHFAAR